MTQSEVTHQLNTKRYISVETFIHTKVWEAVFSARSARGCIMKTNYHF
jgi:hypothetical protein